jgi:dolichyl-phosphate beta-glucosyltransferase
MKNIFLSVIIPCYNEAENISRGVLKDVRRYLKTKDSKWEVIISDDGSIDESKALIKKQIKSWKHFKLLENEHGGKPYALWQGIKKAKGKYILFSDMDQSTPIDELDRLLPGLKEDFDVIIGSRGLQRKQFPLYRKIGAVVFISLRKSLILSDINDTQCGFKLFKHDMVAKAFPKLEFLRNRKTVKGWKVTSFDVELLHIIEKMGGKIKEVRVKWHDADVSKSKGGSLNRYFNESKEMFTQIIRVKWNDVKGYY